MEAGVCYATTAKGDVLKVDLATGEKLRVRSGLGGPIFGAASIDTKRCVLCSTRMIINSSILSITFIYMLLKKYYVEYARIPAPSTSTI